MFADRSYCQEVYRHIQAPNGHLSSWQLWRNNNKPYRSIEVMQLKSTRISLLKRTFTEKTNTPPYSGYTLCKVVDLNFHRSTKYYNPFQLWSNGVDSFPPPPSQFNNPVQDIYAAYLRAGLFHLKTASLHII